MALPCCAGDCVFSVGFLFDLLIYSIVPLLLIQSSPGLVALSSLHGPFFPQSRAFSFLVEGSLSPCFPAWSSLFLTAADGSSYPCLFGNELTCFLPTFGQPFKTFLHNTYAGLGSNLFVTDCSFHLLHKVTQYCRS